MGGVPKRVHPENHGFILQDDYMGGVPKRVHPENHGFTTKCGQTWKKNWGILHFKLHMSIYI